MCSQAFLYDLEKVIFALKPQRHFLSIWIDIQYKHWNAKPPIFAFTGDQSFGEIHTKIRISNQQGKNVHYIYICLIFFSLGVGLELRRCWSSDHQRNNCSKHLRESFFCGLFNLRCGGLLRALCQVGEAERTQKQTIQTTINRLVVNYYINHQLFW